MEGEQKEVKTHDSHIILHGNRERGVDGVNPGRGEEGKNASETLSLSFSFFQPSVFNPAETRSDRKEWRMGV